MIDGAEGGGGVGDGGAGGVYGCAADAAEGRLGVERAGEEEGKEDKGKSCCVLHGGCNLTTAGQTGGLTQ